MRIVELLKKNQEAIRLMNLEFDQIQKVAKIEIAIGPLAGMIRDTVDILMMDISPKIPDSLKGR